MLLKNKKMLFLITCISCQHHANTEEITEGSYLMKITLCSAKSTPPCTQLKFHKICTIINAARSLQF